MTEQSKETKMLIQQRNDLNGRINELNSRRNKNRSELIASLMIDASLIVGDVVSVESVWSNDCGDFVLHSVSLGYDNELSSFKGYPKLKSGEFSKKQIRNLYGEVTKKVAE